MAPNFPEVDSPPELPEKKLKVRIQPSKSGIDLHEIPWKIVQPTPDSIWSENSRNQKIDSNFTSEFEFKNLENDSDIIFRPVKLLKMVSEMENLQIKQFVNNVQDGNWESVSLKIVTKAFDALKNFDNFRKL